jgi:hypothetical protein
MRSPRGLSRHLPPASMARRLVRFRCDGHHAGGVYNAHHAGGVRNAHHAGGAWSDQRVPGAWNTLTIGNAS